MVLVIFIELVFTPSHSVDVNCDIVSIIHTIGVDSLGTLRL